MTILPGYEKRIRPDIREALDRWGTGENPYPGGFVRAVLENDLHMAVARADSDNIQVIPEIMTYVVNKLPSASWGSPERVQQWENSMREESI